MFRRKRRTRSARWGEGTCWKSDRLCAVLWLTVFIPRLRGRKHQRPLGPDRLSHSSSLTDSTFDSFFFLICATLNPLLPVWRRSGCRCVGFSCTWVTCSVTATPELLSHLIGRHVKKINKIDNFIVPWITQFLPCCCSGCWRPLTWNQKIHYIQMTTRNPIWCELCICRYDEHRSSV